jgi:glycosyltransferase involved in cell wall biosynthesis
MTEKIRILQLIDGLNIGGAEVLLRDLCTGLQERGFEVGVGYSTPGPIIQDLQAIGIQPVHLPKLARIDPVRYGSGLMRLITSFKPHIVHTHLFKSDFHGRIAAALCNTPVIISTLHNNDPWARHWLFGPVYGFTARQASRLIAVAPEVKEFHAQYSKIPADKIVTILNGVNIDRFRENKFAGLQVRQGFNITPTTPLVGIIGRLKPQKDHATFLFAAAEILKKIPQTRFLIVGDGPLRSELESQAANLQIKDAVIFCGVRSDIPAILSALDILVMSSRWEGLPITLLEGMASGRAIVTTAVPGILDVIEPEKTALTIAPGDSLALANACTDLLADPSKRVELGEQALKSVLERFSIQAMITKTVLVYQTALKERGIQIDLPEMGVL